MTGRFLEQVLREPVVGQTLKCVERHLSELHKFSLSPSYLVSMHGGRCGIWDDEGDFTYSSWSKFVGTCTKNSVEVNPKKEYPNFYKEKECLVYYKTIRDHLDFVRILDKEFVLIGGDNFTPKSDEVFEEIMERLSNDPSIKQNTDIE